MMVVDEIAVKEGLLPSLLGDMCFAGMQTLRSVLESLRVLANFQNSQILWTCSGVSRWKLLKIADVDEVDSSFPQNSRSHFRTPR